MRRACSAAFGCSRTTGPARSASRRGRSAGPIASARNASFSNRTRRRWTRPYTLMIIASEEWPTSRATWYTTNVVEDMVDKPTAESSPTRHLERWEAALLLEAARRLFPVHAPGWPIYPLHGSC